MRCVGGEIIRGGDDIFEKEMAVICFWRELVRCVRRGGLIMMER